MEMRGFNVRYTAIDLAYLGVVAAVSGVIFALTWEVYYIGELIGGPIGARILSYGLWFIGAPLAATLIKKPLSAFLGETLGALVETIIPTYGGFTNLIYGVSQGLFSELVYLLFRYRRFDSLTATLAGAVAGIPAVYLDALLFEEIYPLEVMFFILIGAMISGGIYGFLSSLAVKAVKH